MNDLLGNGEAFSSNLLESTGVKIMATNYFIKFAINVIEVSTNSAFIASNPLELIEKSFYL